MTTDTRAFAWKTGAVLFDDGKRARCQCACGETFEMSHQAVMMRRTEGRMFLRCPDCARGGGWKCRRRGAKWVPDAVPVMPSRRT